MALVTGRRAGGSSAGRIALSLSFLLAGGLCLAVAFLGAPILGALAGAALAAAALGGVATALALRRARRLAGQVEKLSGEIDLLSRRLLTLEQREAPAVPHASIENGLSEVTAEIGLLGGIVRELAMAVAAQDEDLTFLKAGNTASATLTQTPLAPSPASQPQPAPYQTAQYQPTRDVHHDVPRHAAQTHVPQAHISPAPVPQAHAGHAAPGQAAAMPAPSMQPPAAPRPLDTTPVEGMPAYGRTAPAPAATAPRIEPDRTPAPSAPWAADPILPRASAPVVSRPFVPEPAAEPYPEAEILAALTQGLEVHLQPIVSLPQRKVAFYEALARLRIGDALLAPTEFLRVLERHGRTTELDRLMLARVTAIGQHLANRGSETPVAYALSPGSLFEPGFLRAVGRLIDLHPELAGRLILALPQRSWRTLDAEQAAALNALRERIGLAVDRVTEPRLDAASLAARGASYAKVHLETLLGEHGPAIATTLARAGIRLVAEGVEREADVPDLIDLDLPLAQGTVFSPPRVVRPEVLSPPTPPAPNPEPTPPIDEPPPVRRAFRDVLRRAV